MTNVSLRKAAAHTTRADALVVGVVSSGKEIQVAPGGEAVASAFGNELAGLLRSLGGGPKVGEVTKVPGGRAVTAGVVAFVGLGDDADVSLESLRRGVGAALRSLSGTSSVALAVPADSPERVRAVAEAAMLGNYAFTRYLTARETESVSDVVVLTDLARRKQAADAVATASSTAAAVNRARDLVNTPPNDLTPASFADFAVEQATQTKVRVKVLDERQLERAGYGGILAVGRGSVSPPRLVRLDYRPRNARAHLAFVGKGITFDTGGVSIKTSTGMMTMKSDMAGAAAAVAATFAIAELGLPVKVTTYACLAENMPSGSATRPGDIITMYGGKTVEVLNTDAEGRLVLADGLVTASEQKPDLIVDIATLTGGCVIALGNTVTGVMSNDDDLLHAFPRVAERAGEEMWPLPITEEVTDKVRSGKIADLSQHTTERAGTALFAAAFLREFVGRGTPWVHLDIAGPSFNSSAPYGYTPRGGTGTGVRTLVQLAVERAAAS